MSLDSSGSSFASSAAASDSEDDVIVISSRSRILISPRRSSRRRSSSHRSHRRSSSGLKTHAEAAPATTPPDLTDHKRNGEIVARRGLDADEAGGEYSDRQRDSSLSNDLSSVTATPRQRMAQRKESDSGGSSSDSEQKPSSRPGRKAN